MIRGWIRRRGYRKRLEGNVTKAYPLAQLWMSRIDQVQLEAKALDVSDPRAVPRAQELASRAARYLRHLHRIRRVQLGAQARLSRMGP